MLWLFLLFPAKLICAQQAAPAAPADNAPTATLSTITELVLVPVQVKDGNNPMLGLKKEDFILRSDRQVQPIRVFEEWASSSSTPAIHPASIASDTSFSSVPQGGLPQQLLIIAIDLVNTPFLEQGRAKQQLFKYLSEDMPQQPFAVVAITRNGLRQIHSFSSDPQVLVNALRRMQTSTSKDEMRELTLESGDARQMALAITEAQIFRVYAEKIAARTTLAALEQIAQAFGGVPGRKSVIWLTGGISPILSNPMSGGTGLDTDLLDDFERAFSAMNTANIAIYPVNVNGIGSSRAGEGPPSAYRNDGLARAGLVSPLADDPAFGIKVLADKTGGKWCTAMTELKTCLDQAVEDSTSYYLLGFYVPQQGRKPGWHKLDVRLASGRGSVRSRSNYYLASRTEPTPKDVADMMRNAANARIDYTGLAFTVDRLPDSSAGANTAILQIRVPASSVVSPSGDKKTLSYDVGVVPLKADGDLVTNVKVTRLDLSPAQTENTLNHGWVITEPSPPLSSATAVKYIIRDNITGRIGSVTVPLHSTATGS
ncbi:MAG: VWA domain-containing protein [Candidatus Korobacteraceae bacterium]